MKWTVGLLNLFRLERDGEVVHRFYGRKHDLLIAYLALRRHQDVGREVVASVLWPEMSRERGRSRLSETLFHLKAELAGLGAAEELVHANRYNLELDRAVGTDVEVFEGLAARALAEPNPGFQVGLFEEAISLYGAGLLPALAEPWLQGDKDRLAAVHEEVLQALGRARERAGALEPARVLAVDMVGAGGRSAFATGGADVGAGLWTARGAADADVAPGPWSPPGTAGAEPGRSFEPPAPEWPAVEPGGAARAPAREGRARGPSLAGLRRRLARRYLALAEEAGPRLWGPEREAWLDRLEAAHGTISAVLEWAIEDKEDEVAVRIAGALWPFWHARRHADEGRRFLERALLMRPGGRSAADARALNGAGALALAAGEMDLARQKLEAAEALWRRIGDHGELARTLNNLAILDHKAGDYAAARRRYDDSLVLVRDAGREDMLARVLEDSAIMETAAGELERAEALLAERLDLGRRLGDPGLVARTLVELATVEQHRERWEPALGYAEEALAHFEAVPDLGGLAMCLRSLGYTFYRQGDLETAAVAYEQSMACSRATGNLRETGESLRYLASMHEHRGDDEEALRLYRQALVLLEDAADTAYAARAARAIAEVEARLRAGGGEPSGTPRPAPGDPATGTPGPHRDPPPRPR